jgi:ferric-dicitrate binding protein FerR (iron transport regulator)
VLGTRFNVSAYPEDKNFNVTLEEGSVELISDRYKNFSKKIEPGELAVFNKENRTYLVEKVNVELYTSWKEGMIHLYNLPLAEVVQKLEKRYNQKFQLDDEVKLLRYTYTIKNEPLSDILRLMETITPIDVIQEGEVISLKYNKNKLK